MTKLSLSGIVLGGALAAGVAAYAGHQVRAAAGAEVLSATPVTRLVKIPREECGYRAGNQLQEHLQQHDTYRTVEWVCRIEYDSHTQLTGEFRVRYRLDAKDGEVVMDHDPGRRIPVKDGQLALYAS